jgi:predicted DCC family thiol-disulfide oxidoreductase YuxK
MKTLKDHVILYDAECPMCKVYTRAFTNTGMLDKTGRAPYQEIPDFACPVVDRQRAVNEIALVDKVTGEVSYGIDSLFKVIAHSFPVFRPLFAFHPFVWLMRKLYAFISYNRKVIIPAPKGAAHAIQPSFNLRYRICYLLFTALVVGSILTAYAPLLKGILPAGGSYREYLIVAGQLTVQGILVSLYRPQNRWDYLGNMMTISLAGALLLLPALAVAHLSPIFAAGWFLLVAALMLAEHIRRSALLSLGWGLTISWIFYRLALITAIFYFAAR